MIGEISDLTMRVMLLGVGATMMMDVWAWLLRRLGVPSLDLALLGRWVGHLAEGRWRHESIARAAPVRGERWLGWTAHYAIGIVLAAIAIARFGVAWVHAPSLSAALAFGLVTVVAPWFVLQPALGLGIASSRTQRPLFNALKSVVTHLVFGSGLYLAARVTASVLPAAS